MKKWISIMCTVFCLALLGCGKEPVPESTPAYGVPPVKKQVVEHVRQVEPGVSVLMYHMVGKIRENDAVIDPDLFRRQMQHLHDQGYHPISLDQLYDYIQNGAPLPDRPVCITFDDGYEDNYTIVYPIMKELNYPWAVFVIGEMTGQPGRLTWEQLKEMKANGVTVGNHTMTHRQTPYLSAEEQRHEVFETQRLLAENLGIENRYFCYPYGLYSQELESILKEAGIVMALTMDPGRVQVGENPMEVRRIWIGNRVDMDHFDERMSTNQYRSL